MQPFAEHLRFDWAGATFEEAEVRQWGDRQGNGVDPLMVPVVAGLNLLGIRTIQSCEGHPDHGSGATFYRLITVVESSLKESKEETLARCQAEMTRFAAFLKARCQARTLPLDKSQISR